MHTRDYKRVMDNIKPDKEFEYRLAGQLQVKRGRRPFKPAAMAVAGLLLVLCFSTFTMQWRSEQHDPSDVPGPSAAAGAIFIPKIKLPANTNAVMNMIGLIVYQGKVYTQTDTHISASEAKKMLGEKLGHTKGTINEWSKQSDFAQELASSIGNVDVYEVKGYDSQFRIMTYQENADGIWAEYYECLNGIQVQSGADIFGQLKIKGNVQAVWWEKFESWNYGKAEYNLLQPTATLQTFVDMLDQAKPVEYEKLAQQGIYDNGEQTQKLLYLRLKDNSEVRLRLFMDGYVRYGFAHVFFQVDPDAFAAMWNVLK